MEYSFDTPRRQHFLKNTIKYQENDIFLGRGSFGCVFKALYRGKKVAVKVIPKHDQFKFSSLKREKNIITFYHPNIIRIFKIVETNESGAMIMERFTNGKSLQYILDHLKKKLELEDRLKIIRDIGNGLKFCHEQKIIHRDLKPDNIMIVGCGNNDYICKLFDFGCSYVLGEKENEEYQNNSNNIMGTIRYSAPELLKGLKPDFPVDIFSMGIILWQIKENEIPYVSIKSNDIILWQVVKNNLRPDSTLLLLTEMYEMNIDQTLRTPNSNHLCKSDIMNKENSLLLQAPLKKSLTPISISVTKMAAINNLSRNDFKRDKKTLFKSSIANSSNLRSIKNITRKNLFDCKSIDLLMNIENKKEENASKENLLSLFRKDHHEISYEKLFKIENEYIRLYKSCWHWNAEKRPQIEEFCSLVTKFIDCLQY